MSKWYDIKKVGNRFYLYLRWRDGDKVRSRYLGRWRWDGQPTGGQSTGGQSSGRPAGQAKELYLRVVLIGNVGVAYAWGRRSYLLGQRWVDRVRAALDGGEWPGWELDYLNVRPGGRVVAVFRFVGRNWGALPRAESGASRSGRA